MNDQEYEQEEEYRQEEYGEEEGYRQEEYGEEEEYGQEGYGEEEEYGQEEEYGEQEQYDNEADGNEGNSNIVEEPFKEIPRFDPAKKSHKEFEVKYKPSQKGNENDSKIDKSKVKSDEKLYFFDKSLKDKLTNDSDFSLLNLFGQTQKANIPERKQKEAKENLFYNVDKHKHFDLYDKHMDYHQPIQDFHEKETSKPSNSTSKSWWENNLFFSYPDDSRLKEGVEFFNNVVTIHNEQFKNKRNQIKKIIKAKIKNNLSKKKQTFPSVRLAPKSRIYAMKMRYHKKFRSSHKK
ncbi:leiomodin-3-like [Cimex lectularius]|uniref:Uncharacterized protein n=1 Tax=Cimex lectularius TaxID=79782 RepID=A0A8I6S6N2_CIMLE|nr:leiomodin-3-like [Cimex lectularius]